MASHSHSEPHVSPLSTYIGVYVILLVLTVVTVGVSHLGLPPVPSIILAMVVASIKAFFVGAWFMHLILRTALTITLNDALADMTVIIQW